MSTLLPYEEVSYSPFNSPITASVIWLHGLGANGHDFIPIVPELGLNRELGVRFIFPHAPSIPVTVNGGYVMPAWYDILEMSIDRKVDVVQIEASAKQIQALIEQEISRGVSADNIVIAGFSQGGAVAFQTALTYDKPLGGLLLLSTYLATRNTIEPSMAQQQLPIAIHHGTQDNVVPVILGQQALDWFKSHDYSAEYFTYPMAHQVCPPEITQIGQWLNQRFCN